MREVKFNFDMVVLTSCRHRGVMTFGVPHLG